MRKLTLIPEELEEARRIIKDAEDPQAKQRSVMGSFTRWLKSCGEEGEAAKEARGEKRKLYLEKFLV